MAESVIVKGKCRLSADAFTRQSKMYLPKFKAPVYRPAPRSQMCFDSLLLDLAVSGDMYLVQYFSMQLYYTYRIFFCDKAGGRVQLCVKPREGTRCGTRDHQEK